MADQVIIADTGPLIAFSKIKHISLLKETLGTVIISNSVLTECVEDMSRPGAKEISEAINRKLLMPHADPDMSDYAHLLDVLGVGEASAIALADRIKAGLLIDEKLGRKVAQKMNLKVIGTAGTLLLAKQKKIIKKITPLIHDLKSAGYYLSKELIDAVLTRAKET